VVPSVAVGQNEVRLNHPRLLSSRPRPLIAEAGSRSGDARRRPPRISKLHSQELNYQPSHLAASPNDPEVP